jgi:hypothetical protein
MLKFGNKWENILAEFSTYLLGNKGKMQSAQSIQVRFVYDENLFRFVYRVDGQPLWNSALAPFKGTNTKSPSVVLEDR